jgi:hypothetical protein
MVEGTNGCARCEGDWQCVSVHDLHGPSNTFITATEEIERRRSLIYRRREMLQQARALHEQDQQALIDQQSEIEEERYATAVNVFH